MEEDFLKNFSYLRNLDGDTLFSYNEDRIGEFTSDTNIPIGLARKILAFRDKKFEGKFNSLLKYTPEMIVAFLRKVLNVREESNENVEKLCDHIIKKHIDGFVFYIYNDYTQFQSDIADKEIVGMYFRKAIVKRNAEFQIQCPNDPTAHDLHPKQVPENISSIENASEFSEKANVKVHKEVLCMLLSLNEIQGSGCEPCQFRLLYGRWTNMNELEKLFAFFFVCREDEYTNTAQQNGLWKQIKNNMNQWLDLLPQNKKELFKESKSGVYIYQRQSLMLSEQCKTACIMDKPYKCFLESDAPTCILLISTNVLRSQNNRYVSKLSSNSKSPEEFHFSFKTSDRYFTFDPENYSSGFQRKNIIASSTDACDKNTVEKVIYTRMSEAGEEKPCKAKETQFVSDVGEINSDNAGINRPKAIKAEPEKHDTETPRKFKEGSDVVMYEKGKIFLQPEDDGTLSNRCIEFKSFFTAKETKFVKFQNEVIRFACGCLNARKNGTIYFGVADSAQKIAGNTYKHGEIVGFNISEIGCDTRPTYTDTLRDGISKCFDGDVHIAEVAKKCISNPIFVKVVIPRRNDFKYVMEVDVEPSSNLCKDYYFTVNLKKIKKQTNKSVKNASVLFLRKGSSTETLESDKMLLFTKLQLPEFINERKNFEEHEKNKTVFKTEEPATKLERLLTRGSSKFDKRFWPLLVLGKPNEEQKQNVKWCESMSFIKLIKSIAVFDFDDSSNKNGLCSFYRNPERSLICTESMFHESAGNLQELANTLGLPFEDKTVWIFANGHDSENKPHFDRSGWHESYSAGVCDAVSFFNQNFVIQKGREIIIVLLFSRDFDGVIDTFNEITKHFGLGPIVIIAEQKRIFEDFAEIIQKEGKGNRKNLEKIAVTGMLWEHVKSTIASLTGLDEKMNCVLPCSSGAHVKAEERFIEFLADISILSAKQCENENFKNSRLRKKFALEQEIQFYKGQHVTWWNFYFNSQVCLRYRYKTIQEKALTLLKHFKEETRKVVTLIIAHEPGAGATTLGYQLLWDFRHKYRCCVVTKLSDMAIKQISSLWKYKEDIKSDFQPNPILLFLDDIQSDRSVFGFIKQLNTEFKKNDLNNGMNCLIIICQREGQLVDHEYGHENIFYLKQELSDEEKTWFADKFDELERTRKELDLEDYKPDHLISFMIMRSEFNPEYIKNTIQHLISTIDQKSNEYKLLMYLSFLTTYTPFTRRGAKVFVPVECCDELMGKKHRFWEEHLSSPLRVLLIFEEKEQASGRQVRIAHPSLGEVILSEIIKNEKVELAEIAREYLCCSLLKNTAYGRKLLVEITLDMLKRRKKEDYDEEKVTKFSPLIQKIESDNCDKAADILKLGYTEFKDPILAQTLARLYLGDQKFDEAITWAKEAADLSSKSSKSYILHTYGLVLREKFKFFTDENVFRPKDANEYLKLILKSLDAFLQGAFVQEDETDTQKFLNLYYAINNINEITSFLMNRISYDAEETNITRYLKDKYYIPGEIVTLWKSFHKELKGMQKHAQDAFKVLEDNVCFHSVFYAPEIVQSTYQEMNKNRFYRRFHYGYDDILEKFSRIYGETSPPVDGGNDAASDCYHRGRLWTLKGHSYMNIFDHLKHMDENQSKAITDQLCEIRDHIAQIKSKDSNDLANQVCVNVALGIVGYQHRDSESSILKTCKQIIAIGDNSNKKVDLAYFFVSMLLWPGGAMHPIHDESLLQASLSYLKKRQQKRTSTVKKNESKSQSITQFFLAKGEGLESLCHRWQTPVLIQKNTNSPSWDDEKTKEKLRRLSGKIETKGNDSISIVVDGNQSGNPVKINKRGPTTGFRSGAKVTFYLGFSIAGPIAYNVKLKSDESKHSEMCSANQFPSSRVQEYIKQPKEELQKLLLKIKRIEWKTPDYLTEREVIP